MNQEDIYQFASLEEENIYLKGLVEQISEELEDMREQKRLVESELEDFQENSRQLERELETSLEQMEKKANDFESRNNRLIRDYDSLREKYEKLQKQTSCQISELQSNVEICRAERNNFLTQIRELEQKNDDLERGNRQLMVSVQEIETRLNLAIERNAILEVEQDDTKAALQRLKDENRDRLQDLKVQVLKKKDLNEKQVLTPTIDSNKLATMDIDTQTAIQSSPLKINPHLGNQNISLTPAARINAMNIVGDLLRKVGALESKLASCRTGTRDSPQSGDGLARDGYRGRRLSRGTSSPTVNGYVRT